MWASKIRPATTCPRAMSWGPTRRPAPTRRSAPITIFVSTGPGQRTVPDVVCFSLGQAKADPGRGPGGGRRGRAAAAEPALPERAQGGRHGPRREHAGRGREPGPDLPPVERAAHGTDRRLTACPLVRDRGVHVGRACSARAVLHEPRGAGVRAHEPARGREGRAVRPLLAHDEVDPAAVPRRVRADVEGFAVTGHVGTERAERLYDNVFFEYGDDSVAQLGGVPARAGQPAAREGDRVGAAGRVPRAVHPLHAVRRQAGGAVALTVPPASRARRSSASTTTSPPARSRRTAACSSRSSIFVARFPKTEGRLGLRLPLDDHGEDVRHAPRAPADRHALEPRRVRRRAGVRDDAADASAPARRGARVRRPHARRAPAS